MAGKLREKRACGKIYGLTPPTSWTKDRDVAKRFSGSDGTILEVNEADVADRAVPRPDIGKYNSEQVVLLQGTIQATPTKP